MRALLIVVAGIVGLCLAYVVTHLALIELGQEIVILHRPMDDGSVSEARLWIVDDDDGTWLHHGYADTGWIRRLSQDPALVIERDGETLRVHGTPDPAADPRVHGLLREKYGFADRLVRFWAGTDTESGFATRATCAAVPVRLTPL